ncbi:hypothetical protein [Natrialbaceae archaeon AArc-T1-2]|uniref:hypothetical protein n=1 Tax=Natrialbaceae archaeon AArc-T1-2 TaxID=3053904 RepID=UPI00255B1228|nr:hypothetical protein [Natrialbaceae archaeon AArc-T1-2]WIV67107.1 hypothetical protein QQ977_15705 [Natrialbaceae archaeon AArc-T1-2]
MSTDADRDLEERDLRAELEDDAAGHRGIPVDAICTGCRQVRVKRVSSDAITHQPQADPISLEASDLTSFKHVCHRCQTATWWNPVAVLTGLVRSERGDDE